MDFNKTNKKLKNQQVKGLFVILITAVLLFSIVPSITFATDTDTANNANNKVVVKAKVASIKITWNANGGNIGKKKTTITNIKKGSNIKKLPVTPKRVGYAFKGWYTKKTGGTKIIKNTKPKNKVTYYAQWKKVSADTSSNTDSKLLGTWKDYLNIFQFNKDGKFSYFYQAYSGTWSSTEGKYKVANGKISFTEIFYEKGMALEKRQKDTVFEYQFGKDSEGDYLLIPNIFSDDKPYLDISNGTKLRKP